MTYIPSSLEAEILIVAGGGAGGHVWAAQQSFHSYYSGGGGGGGQVKIVNVVLKKNDELTAHVGLGGRAASGVSSQMAGAHSSVVVTRGGFTHFEAIAYGGGRGAGADVEDIRNSLPQATKQEIASVLRGGSGGGGFGLIIGGYSAPPADNAQFDNHAMLGGCGGAGFFDPTVGLYGGGGGGAGGNGESASSYGIANGGLGVYYQRAYQGNSLRCGGGGASGHPDSYNGSGVSDTDLATNFGLGGRGAYQNLNNPTSADGEYIYGKNGSPGIIVVSYKGKPKLEVVQLDLNNPTPSFTTEYSGNYTTHTLFFNGNYNSSTADNWPGILRCVRTF